MISPCAPSSMDYWLKVGEPAEVNLGALGMRLTQNHALRDELLAASRTDWNNWIIDIWLMDIQAILAKHGYALRVYKV